ncbi:MAG: hypothetical protein R3244_06145, partial [Thermoanaerobaculia bacterium]|nr:hypothetical protein [Thermoanaerobaculia bacterium]
MPKPPDKRPDRHYDFRFTNVVFAWSALALLATTAWMIIDDYNQPWKRYQAEFRDRERAMLEREADEEQQQIDEQRVAEIRSEIEAEEQQLAERAETIEALEEEIERLEKRVYEADSRFRQTKAFLDTAKYELDQAIQHDENVAAHRQEYQRLLDELRDRQLTLEGYRLELADR